jgi:Icc protein
MHTLANQSTASCFTLIQVTDCHLLAEAGALLKGVSPQQTLKAVCGAIARQRADALLLTGDLSQDGSAASYSNLLNCLEDLKLDAFALAGNHDNFDLMHSLLQPRISLNKSFAFGAWRVLLLHSPVESEVHGHIKESELLWLQQQLDAFPDRYFLIALHHHPVPTGSEWMDRIGLQNPSTLQTLLVNYPRVRVLIYGHTHQVGSHVWQHIACYGTPSSWRQFSAYSRSHRMDFLPPAYRVIELFDNGDHRSWIEFVRMT